MNDRVNFLPIPGYVSVKEAAEMLGLSVLEAEDFLKKHGVDILYTLEDLEADHASLKRILPK